ncbi:restriction endonuclease fold toxin [Listeria booriae]|uniref:restriction endonuclease fold toxin n=1 Tax=Listeria booriae TaxID=1552123 RepID=UPI001C8C8FD7|nr:restriction endonuclease fold toxin [Listeria booriae]
MAGVIRDFSQASIDKIAGLVQKEENDGQWGIADWLDDTFTSAGDIQDSLGQLDKYHRDVIDDQNIGVEKFDSILKEVESVDQNYASRFYSLYDKLEGLNDKIIAIGNMITPSVITTTPENFTQITTGTNTIFDSVISDADGYISDLEESMEVVLEEEKGLFQKFASGALGIGAALYQDVVGSILINGEDFFHQALGIGNGHMYEDSFESMNESITSWGWIDEQWYYGGKCIGDGASVVLGIAGVILGVGMVGTAVGVEGIGIASLAIPGVGEITVTIATAGAVALAASGVAVAGVGAGAAFSGAGNIKDNWMRMESAGGTDSEGISSSPYSGDLVKVPKPDDAADLLAERVSGESRVRFENDPKGREFDVISDEFVAQAKPALNNLGTKVRSQMRATFEAAKRTGKKVYYQFEGEPAQEVIDKLYEYSERFGVEVVIDTTPLK